MWMSVERSLACVKTVPHASTQWDHSPVNVQLTWCQTLLASDV